jgi:predicted  nucleic acid-binding Zn-ribbon protein
MEESRIVLTDEQIKKIVDIYEILDSIAQSIDIHDEIYERIHALEEENEQLSKTLQDMLTRQKGLEDTEEIAIVKKQIEENKKELERISSEYASVKGEVTEIRNSLKLYIEGIESIKETVALHDTYISEVQDTVQQLQKQTEVNTNDISELKIKQINIEEKLIALSDSVKGMQGIIESLETRIVNTQNIVNLFQDQQNVVNSRVDASLQSIRLEIETLKQTMNNVMHRIDELTPENVKKIEKVISEETTKQEEKEKVPPVDTYTVHIQQNTFSDASISQLKAYFLSRNIAVYAVDVVDTYKTLATSFIEDSSDVIFINYSVLANMPKKKEWENKFIFVVLDEKEHSSLGYIKSLYKNSEMIPVKPTPQICNKIQSVVENYVRSKQNERLIERKEGS